MRSIVKNQWNSHLKIYALLLWFFLSLSLGAHAAEVDLKPGDVIGPHNSEKVKGMVGDNLLDRIKQGYSFKIKEPTRYDVPREYLEATKKYSGKVRLGTDGELLNHVAGLPFPQIDPRDPQAGQKVAWNYYWRWQGDDFKTGGGTETGKVIRHAIEKDGSERRADFISYFLFPRTRVTLDPKPVIPGYEHIDSIQLRIDSYPRDASGTTILEIRYSDPRRPDDLYLYIPSLRRIRRGTTTQRCQTLAPSEFNLDDIDFFKGKVTDFNYKLLGGKKALVNYAQKNVPYHRKKGDYLPGDEEWEVQDVYVLEITPKDPGYCYPKKILWIDQVAWEPAWGMVWDSRGEYWKEMVLFRIPAKLADGQVVWQQGTGYIVNVQNGRSTVLTTTRLFNQGYRPTMFTLDAMHRVMRGGSIE
ncbi:MAG: DUF1329 domain-containing protein [Deltaproteobacteria bacterium]|nr:DUF1329 domain-containing protein [Deltaproteobacteria bacterium]